MSHRWHVFVLCAPVLAACGHRSALAVDYLWSAGSGGAWVDSAHWNPSGGPPGGIADTASVNNGATAETITLDADILVGRLSVGYVTDATDQTGSVVLDGGYTLSIGQAGASGLLHVGSGWGGGAAYSDTASGDPVGTLELGSGTTVSLVGGTFYLGSRQVALAAGAGGDTTGTCVVTEGATLNVGAAANRSSWTIGLQYASTGGSIAKGTFEATGGNLTAYLSTLTVGENVRGGAHASGAKGEGILDLTGLQGATISAQRLYIGRSHTGNADGTVKLGSGSSMSVGTDSLAGTLTVGALGTGDTTSGAGGNVVTGSLQMGAGSSLTIGTATQAASMVLGQNAVSRGTTVSRTAELIATGGTFAAHLSSLVVGDQRRAHEDGKTFTATGTLDLREAAITDFRVTGDVTIGYSTASERISPNDSGLSGTLKLWLDAADIHNDGGLTNPKEGTTINQWSDKSGNGLAASVVSGYSGPTYCTSGAELYNGNPVVSFVGETGEYERLRVTDFVTNELADTRFTVFVVMDGSQGIANAIPGTVPRLYLTGSSVGYNDQATVLSWANPAGYGIHTYQHDGTNLSAWLNSVLMDSETKALASTVGNLEIPFHDATGVNRFAEILVFTHEDDSDVFTEAERLAIEQCLYNKYVGQWQNSQGYVYLSQVDGSIGGTLRVGDTAAGSEGLLQLHGTHLDVTGDVAILDTGTIRVFVSDVSAGLSLQEAGLLAIGNGATYDILFEADPLAGSMLGSAEDYDVIHYGLKWEGDHVDALLAAAINGKLTWDDTALSAAFNGAAGVFYDAGANATYVGFYVIPEPSAAVLLAAVLAMLAGVRVRSRRP